MDAFLRIICVLVEERACFFEHILSYKNFKNRGKEIALYKDPGEIYFIKCLLIYYFGNANPVFFDIGSNVGCYTDKLLQSRKDKGSFHLFEPTNKSFQEMVQKYKDKNHIYLNKLAVSDKKEQVSIFYDKEGSKLASLYKRDLKNYFIEMNKSEKVETIRLDDYINEHQIQQIHLLKMDTEGHELAVLKSVGTYLNSNFIDFIQFEYGGTYLDANIRLFDMYEILEKAGFKVGKLNANGIKLGSYEPEMEDYRYANYVAISQRIVNSIKYNLIFGRVS